MKEENPKAIPLSILDLGLLKAPWARAGNKINPVNNKVMNMVAGSPF